MKRLITKVMNKTVPARKWTARWGTSIDNGNVPPTRPVDFKSMERMTSQLQRLREHGDI
jgi:hypothetical protein